MITHLVPAAFSICSAVYKYLSSHFNNGSKDREPLGIARIIRKQEKDMANKYWEYRSRRDVLADSKCIHPGEALADGFISQHGAGDVKAMLEFLREPRRGDIINKITLYWIERTK